jgi:hypothetical protein
VNGNPHIIHPSIGDRRDDRFLQAGTNPANFLEPRLSGMWISPSASPIQFQFSSCVTGYFARAFRRENEVHLEGSKPRPKFSVPVHLPPDPNACLGGRVACPASFWIEQE